MASPMTVMIIIIMTAAGHTSTAVAYFQDRAACQMALDGMRDDLRRIAPPTVTVYFHCQDTKSTPVPGPKP
jgi:dihydroorotase-like cyclic amidohydrolase